MSQSLSVRRMAENQVVFREYNESVQKRIDSLRQMAKETGQESLVPQDDTPLHFYCECSDENCRKRIQLKPSQHNAIHKNRKRFIIVPGHEIDSIERIVKETSRYFVVEKFVPIPATANTLKFTPANNS